ncbi:MAG: hypothetical protein US83_C0015G0007 [Candidatus Falkowbacteria bacterium GW2011_GWC2_38_22]|nr:MAG: hypothetical protein US73_C0013G0007 [Candidatus Falkowbacteria bacterium GW2011_GWF2_38_1205]KKQ60599.1 MAG: hypothetical protein US83_C0015G0007 [Candidatus Falkowbacteria bacterium GW2011_GWC2_38_22]KKQ62690.1 MAG: hypothetical protein US84_C0012G0007 [Candidatus Falkowbacteria bacterium GW2011_GWF1_38_22]KKQ64817.1 MAG: hypothetical protein US87_C0012G0007 [Candidatus Falkowbacteria bacterium GW2011_GWE2_38_254]KKQ72059.1 MAG: hypothetical protein US93_C0012G0007 [Candidatus Falkowb
MRKKKIKRKKKSQRKIMYRKKEYNLDAIIARLNKHFGL